MGKSAPSAPSPDPAIGEAALKNAEIGEDWLKFMEGQADISTGWAQEDRDRYTSIFQPIEEKFVKDALKWDTPARQQKLAAEAAADVRGAAAAQDDIRGRQMMAMGLRPDSGRYAGIDRAAGNETALAVAGAENIARNQVRSQALALKGDAIGLGRGLPSQAMGALGLSNSAANSGFGGAQQGYANQANILQNQYNSQLQAWGMESQMAAAGASGIASGIGSIIGLGASFLPSSEDIKKDKTPSKGNLEAVEGMRVDDWTYKDGEGDGGRHTGTYAQDFKRETGKGDGKSIPVIDAIGTTMGAVKELSAKVDRLASAVGKGQGLRQRRAA